MSLCFSYFIIHLIKKCFHYVCFCVCFLIGVQLIHHFVLVPGVQKNDSVIHTYITIFSDSFPLSVQFSSVAQSCLTLCDPVNRGMPGLPVHHQLPEFTQTHAHWVGDAIQSSHPLSSPSPAPNPSQHQGLFQLIKYWVQFPVLYSRSSFIVYFKYSSVYMLTPKLLIYPSPLPPLVTISLLSMLCAFKMVIYIYMYTYISLQ